MEHTYAPTTVNITLNAFFSIIAKKDIECIQLDVSTAFLYGELKEEIYMDIPEGFGITTDKSKEVRLNKAVYGLK